MNCFVQHLAEMYLNVLLDIAEIMICVSPAVSHKQSNIGAAAGEREENLDMCELQKFKPMLKREGT